MRYGFIAPACSLICSLTLAAPALSQDASQGQLALKAVSQRIADSGSGTATWALEGIAPEMFAATTASGSGELFWIRGEIGTDEGHALRLTGRGRANQTASPEQIDMLFTPDKVSMLNEKESELIERTPNGRPHQSMALVRQLMLDLFIEPEPFDFEIEFAESIEITGTEDIDGQTYDVIEVRLPTEPTVTMKTQHPRRSDNIVRVYASQDDRLPRRIELISESMLGSLGRRIELTNIVAPAGLDPAEVTHSLPGGWTVDSTLPSDLRTPDPDAATTPARQSSSQQTAPQTPSRPAAPAYTFVTADNVEVSNQSQAGQVTVLYFWGTWCLPCHEISPLITELANEGFQGLDVFGLAVRERDPNNAAERHADQAYGFELALNADNLTTPFRVRTYPTAIVIDQNGGLVDTIRLGASGSPEAFARDLRNAIVETGIAE